jgi:hypothetical protein
MNIQFRRNLLAGVAFALLLPQAAAGQFRTMKPLTMTVNSQSDLHDETPGDGICQAKYALYRTCTLRAAIEEANAYAIAGPHTIYIMAGTYTLVGAEGDDDNLSGDLDIKSNVTLVGAGAATTILTILPGKPQSGVNDRVVHVFTAATVTIDGVTITGGILESATGGAGIRNAGNLTLRNCVVHSNGMNKVSNDGGGIYNEAPPTAWDPPPTLNLYNTTVWGNNASHGAGIYNRGVLNITDSAISRNEAENTGGGVYAVASGSTTVTRSTIDGNSATYGGGLNIDGGALTMSNCTVSGNVGRHGRGGALWLASKNATIGSCTFHNNTNGVFSGWEKENAAMYVNSGTVSVRATIFDESGPADSTRKSTKEVACKRNGGTIVSQGYNIDLGASCQFGGADQSDTDAKLDPNLANNGGPTQTHALLAGSPAIDAIHYLDANNAGFVPSTDQRGVGRPQVQTGFVTYWVVDIGAFEYVYLPTLTLF